MPAIPFTVTQRVGKWFVDVASEVHGPYLSQWDATADAIDAAEQTSTKNTSTVVVVKVRGKPEETIWSSRTAVSDDPSAI